MNRLFNKLFLTLLPSLFFLHSLKAQDDVIISISSDTVAVGDTFCLALTVEHFVQIVGIQTMLNWNSQYLKLINIETIGLTAMEQTINNFYGQGIHNLMWNWEDADPGQLGTTVSDGDTALILCFKALRPTVKSMVTCSGMNMPPSAPVAIENYQGINLYNDTINVQGMVFIADSTSGLTDLTEPSLYIYPNPFRQELYVSGEAGVVGSIRILNTAGTIFFAAHDLQTGEKITLSDLVPGLYFIELTRPDGIRTKHKLLHVKD